MNEIYRFLGTEAVLANTRLEFFGVAISLTPDYAQQAVLAGVQILKESEFKELGFTPEDLKVWASPFQSPFDVPTDKKEATAKARFLELKEKGLEKCRANQQAAKEALAEANKPKNENVVETAAATPANNQKGAKN